MKKAYNVYSILGKAVSKAAMLTSVFALCFLFSGQAFSQASAPDAIFDDATTMELMSTVRSNSERLNPASITPDGAQSIARALYQEFKADYNPDTEGNQEIEMEIRKVFVTTLVDQLNKSIVFDQAFTRAQSAAQLRFMKYGSGAYTGPNTVPVIAEEIIAKFF